MSTSMSKCPRPVLLDAPGLPDGEVLPKINGGVRYKVVLNTQLLISDSNFRETGQQNQKIGKYEPASARGAHSHSVDYSVNPVVATQETQKQDLDICKLTNCLLHNNPIAILLRV